MTVKSSPRGNGCLSLLKVTLIGLGFVLFCFFHLCGTVQRCGFFFFLNSDTLLANAAFASVNLVHFNSFQNGLSFVVCSLLSFRFF